MDIIMDNTETEAAIRLYLQSRNIITNGEHLYIEITKLRNTDGDVSTAISILDEAPVNSTVASQPKTTEPELEPDTTVEPEKLEPDSTEPAKSTDDSTSAKISNIFGSSK